MNINCMFSSEKDNWQTPKQLFYDLNKKYKFTVDLCADDYNKLCKKYFTIVNSCLDKELKGEIIFCNPPYR